MPFRRQPQKGDGRSYLFRGLVLGKTGSMEIHSYQKYNYYPHGLGKISSAMTKPDVVNDLSLIEASAIAGLATRALLHPIDTCKVVTQVADPRAASSGFLRTSAHIFRQHGAKGLYRGFPAALIGTVPGVTFYFSSYNYFKYSLDGLYPSHANLVNFVSGFLAEVVSCVVWVPTDVLKERAQALNKLSGRAGSVSASASFREVFQTEGIRGLYRGYGATLASFGPFSAFYFMFVEQLKQGYTKVRGSPATNFYELMPICAAAGGAAAVCSAPMDLVKVRMQVERQSNSHYKGFVPSLLTIWKNEGFRGLFRGGGSRVWFAIPNTAITMSLMESIKQRLA